MSETATPLVLPDTEQETQTRPKEDVEPGYLVICWDDPVNLMDYVTHVFQVVFGWTKAKSEFHMLEVHNQGKSVLTRESLEKAEHYVHQLQKYSLHATMERDQVKLIKTETNKFVFHISQREKHLLFDLLKLYPLVRSDYQPLSKTAEPVQMKVDQQLLEDALSAQKLENKKELEKFLKEQKRFSEHKGGYRFGLDIHQMEWLLQILNDIRVGNWLLLGSPEPAQTKGLKVNERNAPHVWAMEISGYFQMVLLDAFNR